MSSQVVRRKDVIHTDGLKVVQSGKVKGKGMYKTYTPSSIIQVVFGRSDFSAVAEKVFCRQIGQAKSRQTVLCILDRIQTGKA